MSIISKVSEIESLFAKLDSEINSFQTSTKLSCIAGCGKCCTHNQIDASPLEFLPWAFQLFVAGEANHVLEELSKSSSKICYNYQPFGELGKGEGRCKSYLHRGLICRLFGYGAASDKYGEMRLTTCKTIKKNKVVAYLNAKKMIEEGLPIPVFTEYYMRLSHIDFHLGNLILPVNEALKIALEEVLHYYSYHNLENPVRVVA